MPINRYRSPLLSYFEYSHLPPHLQAASRPFAQLASSIAEVITVELDLYATRLGKRFNIHRDLVEVDLEQLPEHLRGAYLQSEAALAKLLEAKDCAVRAALSVVKAAKHNEQVPPACDNGHELAEGCSVCPQCGAGITNDEKP